ncbi:MAG: hypothetical protein HY754_12050 [Nitrospirae bacterium]|nr:hypothetical protein [Nitrospirota bacterium]
MLFIACAAPKIEVPEIKPPEVTAHEAKNCSMCHLSHKGEEKPLLGKPAADICVSCHQERIGKGEHAVGIKVSVTVEGFPLDPDGRITCITCHDPHGTKGYEMLLRFPNNSAFCIKCHKE